MAIILKALGLVTSLGVGKAQNYSALIEGQCGFRATPLIQEGSTFVGAVDVPLVEIPPELKKYSSRNLSLALMAVQEIDAEIKRAITQYGRENIAVIAGSSTSGIEEGTTALGVFEADGHWPVDYDFALHEMGAVAESIARYYNITGPAFTISTACSSGAKAMASARRLITQGQVKAVIVGGADSLARLTLNGFNALTALSKHECKPFDRARDGINIGEGAAFFLMEQGSAGIALSGIGESSDSYNMTAPHPEGEGARAAISLALADAGLMPQDIGYINLHGTGTQLNDAMEAKVVNSLFGDQIACSSSKGQVGHILGASGAIEAAFCWLILDSAMGHLPPHTGYEHPDEALPEIHLVSRKNGELMQGRHILSSSYAFGGSNINLVLSLLVKEGDVL